MQQTEAGRQPSELDPTAVGAAIRRARVTQGMSLREMARRLQVSAGHVSQVERGLVAPSVALLYAIVGELDIPFDSLFAAEHVEEPATTAAVTIEPPRTEGEERYVVRSNARRSLETDTASRWELLTPTPQDPVDFWEITHPVGAPKPEEFLLHPGREYGLVTHGVLHVQIAFQEFALAAGDSLVFDASTPHRVWNEGEQPARVVWWVVRDVGHGPSSWNGGAVQGTKDPLGPTTESAHPHRVVDSFSRPH